jgi:hypothetical protein
LFLPLETVEGAALQREPTTLIPVKHTLRHFINIKGD